MTCVSRIPRCGGASSDVVSEPWTEVAAAAGVVGTILTVFGIFAKFNAATGMLIIGGVTIGSAAVAGTLAGAAGAIATILVVGLYVINRCIMGGGLPECIAGVVNKVTESFSESWEYFFPFAAVHDRIDVVVRSRFWDVVEMGLAHVHCTDEMSPRRSAIIRCYYFDPQVCNAGKGAIYGASIGGGLGIIAGAAAASAIGCATVIFCIFALLIAAIIAAAAALLGALAGGHIGRALSEKTSPTDAEGNTLALGDYISVTGNMQRREFDDSANVFWWVSSTTQHGRASDEIPRNPFCYCEVDDEFTFDGCPIPGPK